MINYWYSITFLLLFAAMSAEGQMLESKVSINLSSGSVDKGILQLQQTTGFPFAYETSGLRPLTIQGKPFKNQSVKSILKYILEGSGYFFEEKDNVIVIGPADANLKMIRGIIEDKGSGQRLTGVAVYDAKDNNNGTFTDNDGYFSLPVESDTLRLRFSYLSYKPVEILLKASNAPVLRIKMDIQLKEMDSVLVVLPSDITPVSRLNKFSPSLNSMMFLPKFFGDIDLATISKTTPGIRFVSDGTGNVIVRGGAPDQNLLLLDDASIYGATHLFGLLSSVNTRAVKEATIYKGAFPARYGGRISSIWDIAMKSGSLEDYHGTLSVGTMSSDVSLQGPLIKNRSSFIVSARKSYHDKYVRLFAPGLLLNFDDVNIKLYHRFSDKDHLYVTGYASGDRFELNNDEDTPPAQIGNQSIALNTKNKAAVLKWKHYFSNRFSTTALVTYSQYSLTMVNGFNFSYSFDTTVFKGVETISNGLSDLSAKWSAKYISNEIHDLEVGVNFTKHRFDPHYFQFDISTADTSFFPPISIQDVISDKNANELDFYAEDNLKISDDLRASIGIHLNNYSYGKTSFLTAQPRVSFRQQITSTLFVNAAYARMQQGLHRLSISKTSLPIDFWIPSTDLIKPQLSNQVSVGVTKRLFGKMEASTEVYYKDMNNVAEYLLLMTDTLTAYSQRSWKNYITTGKGTAYGIECSINKNTGRFRYWTTYVLAWVNRTMPEINNGLTFPYKYDRRHSANVVTTYKLSDAIELSAVFSFQSRPKTPVLIIKSTDVSDNSEVLKQLVATTEQHAYHRLDMGVNWVMQHNSEINSILNLSILNVYNKRNDFYYFSTNNSNQLAGTPLLPIGFSISYTLSF